MVAMVVSNELESVAVGNSSSKVEDEVCRWFCSDSAMKKLPAIGAPRFALSAKRVRLKNALIVGRRSNGSSKSNG